ncbi:MAG: 16S rRNA (uracil(1498)-N(3))-methyltransferase [Clostridiales bacterium]|nr:16S rRNA (uracil(1498)-N(3))-methyltransferase [Clostridiales bacterium]
MFNFFVDESNKNGRQYTVDGADYKHIKNVLRMKIGEECLVSCNGKSDLCRIEAFFDDSVSLEVIEENYIDTELPVKIYLFQGLPKGDKMELIIQKCVELGVYGIMPVQMKNCVVKIEEKKKDSKKQRWQAISESAAKQSKRNVIPEILDISTFDRALDFAKDLDIVMVPYENEEGIVSTIDVIKQLKGIGSLGIFIGPEGGFDKTEIDKARSVGAKTVSLGKRILRTETAAVTAVAMCMLGVEMLEVDI